MSFSKATKGSFSDVRNWLSGVAQQVHDDDVKGNASEIVARAHHLQARTGVRAAIELLAEAPFRAANPDAEKEADRDVDKDIAISIYGSANEDGSGSVGIQYSFSPAV